VNGYEAQAQAHWQAYLPEGCRQIPEHERPAFFARLGEDIEARIAQRTNELADRAEPAEPVGFQARYALLNTLPSETCSPRCCLSRRTRMKWLAANADQPARSWRAPAS
jgi:hypothetical protein